jgi:hypothetical protein
MGGPGSGRRPGSVNGVTGKITGIKKLPTKVNSAYKRAVKSSDTYKIKKANIALTKKKAAAHNKTTNGNSNKQAAKNRIADNFNPKRFG